jgi:hypothetical protein
MAGSEATIDPQQRYSQARTVELPRGGTYAELLLAEVHAAIRSRLNERAAVVPKRRRANARKGSAGMTNNTAAPPLEVERGRCSLGGGSSAAGCTPSSACRRCRPR